MTCTKLAIVSVQGYKIAGSVLGPYEKWNGQETHCFHYVVYGFGIVTNGKLSIRSNFVWRWYELQTV